MQFTELVGESIFLLAPRIDEKTFKEVKLVGVESGGLWIESQDLTNAVLHFFGAPAAKNTPIFFLPYHEISLALTTVSGLALGEKAFGV